MLKYNQLLKLLLFNLVFIPSVVFSQETNYYFNESKTPSVEWDLNEDELTDITYSVQIPPIAYEFDLVTVNVYKVIDGEVNRFDSYEYGKRYTRLKLKNEKSGVIRGEIINDENNYLKGDFSRIYGSDFIDREENSTSFFIGLYGFEISGHEERYNSSRRVYESYPVYNSGTLINEQKMAKVYQRDGWEKRKTERLRKEKTERDAAIKKERRTTILTYAIGGAIGVLLAVLLYS